MSKYIGIIILILFGAYLLGLSEEQTKPKTGGPFGLEGAIDKPKAKYKYLMYVPEEYTSNRSWPLMVVLHGAGDTAESIINDYTSNAKKNQYIIAALQSQLISWSGIDNNIIPDMMEHIRKDYNIDPDRVFLSGFSAGGFVTCTFGFAHRSLFRGLGPQAAAKSTGAKRDSGDFTVLIVCGDKDDNYQRCKQVYETLKSLKLDTEFYILPGVGHDLTPEGVTWIFDNFQERLNQPDALLSRGKKALTAKRYLDALDCFKAIIDGKMGDKWEKPAQQEVQKIEQTGSNKFDQALTKLKANNTAEATKLLKEIVGQFEGTPVWSKAKEKLSEIENAPAH